MRIMSGLICTLVLAPHAAMGADLKAVDRWRAAHEPAIIGQLDELVRMRSVAADPKGLAATATRLEGLLKARGFSTSQLTIPGAPPLVTGTLLTQGAQRTVTFYAHYDGTPVTPSQWQSAPFAPVMRDGARTVDWKAAKAPFNRDWRFYGRAAADDKAGIVAFLAAFDALKAGGQKPSVNLKVVWEGEEERSSPHLTELMRLHAKALRSDLWLIGDGPLHQSRTPTLYFGTRGMMPAEATIYGPLRPLHDGHYGNWAPNPAVMAAELIASLRDSEGNIRILGFADDVAPLSQAARAAIAALPPVEAALKKEFALPRSEGREGLTASTMRPALNIRGMSAGGVGAASTASIPSEASISMDFRIVPGQTPERVRQKVEAFLIAHGWKIVRQAPDATMRAAHPKLIKLVWGGGYVAQRTDMSAPAAKAAIAAGTSAAGKPVVQLPMMGASVPLSMIKKQFGVPLIGLPISNHDNNQHTADENIRLGNLWDGIRLYAAMIANLSW